MINFRKKYPIIAGTLCAILMLAVQAVVQAGFALLTENMTYPKYLHMLLADAVCIAVGIALAFALGLKDIFRSSREGFLHGLGTGGYFIFISVSTLIVSISSSKHGAPLSSVEIAVFVLAMAAVGFAEEIFFRGILSRMIFEKYGEDACGVWFSAIVSGLIFGSVHFINALHADIVGVAVQAVCAAAIGICLTALYYRTGNIYVVASLHAFMDFCALFSSGVFGEGSLSGAISNYSPLQLISALPYIVVSLILLRRLKMAALLHKPSDSIIAVIGKLSSSQKSKNRLMWLIFCIVLAGLAVYAAKVIRLAIKL